MEWPSAEKPKEGKKAAPPVAKKTTVAKKNVPKRATSTREASVASEGGTPHPWTGMYYWDFDY